MFYKHETKLFLLIIFKDYKYRNPHNYMYEAE